MPYQVHIHKIQTVHGVDFYWTQDDYTSLLKELDYPDADRAKPEELLSLVQMALTDFEPDEAARVVLTYKLGDRLTDGQIQSLSHEMIEDKVAEEYPDPAFHFDLFNINELLYTSFEGTFPHTEATKLEVEIKGGGSPMTKEVLIKILGQGLVDRSIIHRLYADQLEGKVPFDDAHKVIWHFRSLGPDRYEVLTSKYWIEREDLAADSYEASVHTYEEED